MPSAPAIAARGVTVRYGDVLALESATLSIAPGRVTGLVGMNGSGKSTLLKALTGMVRPDEGGDRAARALRLGGPRARSHRLYAAERGHRPDVPD